MKNAQEMVKYAESNGLVVSCKDACPHFNRIEQNLMPREDVLAAMSVQVLFSNIRSKKEGLVLAVTNERIIAACGGDWLQKKAFMELRIENVTDVYISRKSYSSYVIIATNDNFPKYSSGMAIGPFSNDGEADLLYKVYDTLKAVIESCQNKSANCVSISSADELKKFKELLDLGVISQEEFDKKKKQILDL